MALQSKPFSIFQEIPQESSETEFVELKIGETESSSSSLYSAPLKTPCHHTLENNPEARQRYFKICVPLNKACINGDWEEAEAIIDKDPDIVRASITKGLHTPLHVAAGTGNAPFVNNLLKYLTEADLLLQDAKGNTAFCFAVASGNVQVAKILIQRNPDLPKIRGGEGMTTLYMAILFGHSEMAWFLYPQLIHSVDEGERSGIFFTCINTELYDLALKMLHGFKELAVARDKNGETALHFLARKSSISVIRRPNMGKRFMKYFKHNGKQLTRVSGLELLKYLWEIILWQNDWMITEVIRKPSHVLFTAARLGNSAFVAELVGSYPDLIWELDDCNRSLFHFSVMYHHTDIFNMVLRLGVYKDFIISYKDEKKNSILHLAAKLAPLHQSNIVSEPALQMQLELLRFEEVAKVVPPFYLEMENSDGRTPRDIFTEEHRVLLEKGESWMKNMASSGTLVSAVIAIPLFASAVLDDRKIPQAGAQKTTLSESVFAISDGVGLLSASFGILVFLSILISRFTETDFLRSLPLKLMVGRIAVFISTISMTVAFGAAWFTTYRQRLKSFPTLIFILASLLLSWLYFLPSPLNYNVLYSTSRHLFLRNKRMSQAFYRH